MTVHFVPIDDPATEPPLDDDGTPLPFAWVSVEGTAFTDSRTEVVSWLVPGYRDAVSAGDDITALQLRLDVLASLALIAQEAALAQAVERLDDDDWHGGGDEDVAALPEPVLTALLSPKDGPIVELDEWPLPIPLYLLSTQYAPYSEITPPRGEHVVLLDPVTETGFLDALQRLGAGTLLVLQNAAADAH